jgi:hypothetical protein
MAVMTHARTQPTSVDYRDLTATQQTQFDLVMDLADDTTSAGQYNSLMLAAAFLAGIHIERGGEVLKCSCTCVCPAIFDNADPDARTIEESAGFNLPIRQCPTCADRHPAPAQD